jgi:lipopolysaccharide/colanic/teichoic acid biosynthesis glycosyltransferase
VKRYLFIKRILDFVFALIFLIMTSSIMFLAAVAIKLESNGPIFFNQLRPGKNEIIFRVFKFRTMIVDIESDNKPLSDVERITKVGSFLRRTSIDELPQLFNILRGEMSFIGTRPLLVQYLEHYSPEQRRRHEVVPGISGWAQVNGRNSISWEEKFILDIWYVDNVNLTLDVKILVLTIKKIFVSKDVDQNEKNTMEDFIGN